MRAVRLACDRLEMNVKNAFILESLLSSSSVRTFYSVVDHKYPSSSDRQHYDSRLFTKEMNILPIFQAVVCLGLIRRSWHVSHLHESKLPLELIA